MKEILGVSLGGAIGATLRYAIVKLFVLNQANSLPWSTLSVNLSGSFFIGVLFYIFNQSGNQNIFLSQFLIVGVLGGFTTFSTFSLDAFQLIERNQYYLLFLYLGISLIGGLSLTWLGYVIPKWLWA